MCSVVGRKGCSLLLLPMVMVSSEYKMASVGVVAVSVGWRVAQCHRLLERRGILSPVIGSHFSSDDEKQLFPDAVRHTAGVTTHLSVSSWPLLRILLDSLSTSYLSSALYLSCGTRLLTLMCGCRVGGWLQRS